jgi:Zn-dependent protease with chaperone function
VSRTLPSAIAIVAALVVATTYAEVEPRGARESVGPMLIVISLASAALLLRGPLRAFRAWRSTRRVESRWLRGADRVDLAGAVDVPVWRIRQGADGLWMSGLLRPRVIVGAGVLDALTPPELDAALRHELAHAAGRDNLVRLCLTGAPGAFSVLSYGRTLEREWSRASESAADSHAAAGAPAAALLLASALVKVARLRPPAALFAASAVDEGDVGARVRELLGAGAHRPLRSRLAEISMWAALLVPVAAVALLVLDPSAAGSAHKLAEHLVRRH